MRARLQIQVPQRRAPRLSKAKEDLQALRDACVDERLANWLNAAQIGEAFRYHFPSQWRRSKTSTKFERGALSEREVELFRLLDERFPMHEWDAYEDDISDDRPDGPPARICSNELNYGYEYTCVSVVQVVLAYLVSWNTTELQRYLTTDAVFGYVLPNHPDTHLDRARFMRACADRQRKTGGAWRDLMRALDVMSLNTGSPFTDAFVEDTFGFDQWVSACGWSRQGLRTMTRAWQRSEKYLDALGRVEAWLEAEPDEWPQVFAIWVSCHGSAEQFQEEQKSAGSPDA